MVHFATVPPMRVFWRVITIGAAVSSLAGRAFADPASAGVTATPPLDNEPAPTLRAEVYSPYERGAIDAALLEKKEEIDPSPEGKRVEGIDIVTLDVFDPRDPAPTLSLGGTVYSPAKIINSLHVTTKHYVIDREILLRTGERYKAVSVEESVRNLRSLPQLSLVLAIPVRGHEPDSVRLLVITKDVWSLRLAWDLAAVPGGSKTSSFQPSETNFLGTHQIASLYFELDPATLSYGAGYHVPRLEGTRNVLDASAQVIFNRVTGDPEGTTGALLAYQPLFSARTPWAWDSQVSWTQAIVRRFGERGGELLRREPSVRPATSPPPRARPPRPAASSARSARDASASTPCRGSTSRGPTSRRSRSRARSAGT